MTTYETLYVAIDNLDNAKELARKLVTEELVACANIVPAITSIYKWKGELVEEQEALILAKTTVPNVPHVIERVKELHPYDTPGVVTMPIRSGDEGYLNWVYAATA